MLKPHIHKSEIKCEAWQDPKPCVVPGLAPSIATMLARAQAGMPRTVATRTIESYYRNQDLTDVAELAASYKALKESTEKKTAALAEMKKQAAAQAQAERQRILNYIKSIENTPSPNS